MQIAISLQENNGLVSQVSTIFGRCPYFMFINPDNNEFEIIENTAKAASGGAGIQAAQTIVDKGAKAVISGNLGPKAHTVLISADIPLFQFPGGSAQEALDAYRQGKLTALNSPSTGAHSG